MVIILQWLNIRFATSLVNLHHNYKFLPPDIIKRLILKMCSKIKFQYIKYVMWSSGWPNQDGSDV